MKGIRRESDSEMGAQESSCVALDTPQDLKPIVDANLDHEMHETGSEDTAYFAASDSELQDHDSKVTEESGGHKQHVIEDREEVPVDAEAANHRKVEYDVPNVPVDARIKGGDAPDAPNEVTFAGAPNDVTFGGDDAVDAPDDAGGAAHQAALERTQRLLPISSLLIWNHLCHIVGIPQI